MGGICIPMILVGFWMMSKTRDNPRLGVFGWGIAIVGCGILGACFQ